MHFCSASKEIIVDNAVLFLFFFSGMRGRMKGWVDAWISWDGKTVSPSGCIQCPSVLGCVQVLTRVDKQNSSNSH